MSKLKEKLQTVKDKFKKSAKIDKAGVKAMEQAARAAREKTTQVKETREQSSRKK